MTTQPCKKIQSTCTLGAKEKCNSKLLWNKLAWTLSLRYKSTFILFDSTHLNKERNTVETSYNSPVVGFACQDMQCTNTSIYNVFHSYAINHHTLSGSPLHVLMSSHHQLDKLWQASMLTDWSVIEGAQCKITHEANNSFYERPARWGVKEFYQDWQAKVNPHRILSLFCIFMATCQMT